MYKYIIRRLLMLIPTLFGVTLICFAIINLAPGSPVEQKIRQLQFGGMGNASAGGNLGEMENAVSEEVIASLRKQYGFDKPIHIRYFIWISNLLTLDFGESFTYEEPVVDVIISKFPVSLQFGIVSFILTYLICIPLGVIKAVKHGSTFDMFSSILLFVMYSVPGFMLAVLLIVFFSGGNFFDWFPIGGLYSDNYDELGFFSKIIDRVHHAFMPLVCYMIGHFTFLSILMKNSILEEIK
ncbi:MAG: ABC transporter permease subunit, partial [Halobacteriovoraceae bacterium]|nr:ABC transporter permease subunit [Halobacteriovoraceae bacterium]